MTAGTGQKIEADAYMRSLTFYQAGAFALDIVETEDGLGDALEAFGSGLKRLKQPKGPDWREEDALDIERLRAAGWILTTYETLADHHRVPFALTAAGGEVSVGAVDFAPHVVIDRELITGQNPRSDHPIAAALVAALDRSLAST